jgi:hypothetical protein
MITGFYGGYLNALSQISGVEEANNRIAARNQQMQLAAKQDYLDDQTRQTLSTAFNTQQQNNTAISQFDLEDQTANQYRNAGKLVMATDPKSGLALLREGDSLSNQNTGRRLEAARVEVIKQDRLASLAGMVSDQEGLDQLIQLKAENGQVVPENFRTWGPATKAWLEREAALGLPQSKAADLALRTKKMEQDAAAEKRRAEQRAEELALKERREARLQSGGTGKDAIKSLSAVTPKSEMAYVSEIQVLNDLDQEGLFGKLDAGVQREAVQDAHLRAKQLVTQNPKITPEQALAQARQEVLQEIVPAESYWGSPTRIRAGKKGAAKTEERPATVVVNGVTYKKRTDGSNLYDEVN